MLQGLFAKIMGFVVIIITLALAPSINTANATIEAQNLTNLIGMTVVSDFGAPLIILGLLVSGGAFALAGMQGKLTGATMSDLFKVIGSVILVIVALTFMDTIIDYTNTLIGSPPETGFALVIYGIIPLIIYVGVIATAGWASVSTYRRLKGGSRRTATATGF
jgi:hypothetical protein